MTQPARTQLGGAVDWRRVDVWHQHLMADRLDAIGRAFEPAGIGGLEVVRSPAPDALRAGTNRFLLEDWYARRPAGGLPPVTAIDPVRWAPALGRILLVEPVEHGADFRYRLFGSDVAAVSGYEMTGKLVSEHGLVPELVCFALALYRTLLVRPEPVLTLNLPVLSPYSCWERIVLPFADPAGEVVRFAVGNVGFGQDGRELHG